MIVNSKRSLSDCIAELRACFNEKKFLSVKIEKATRLQIQNRWIQKFYNMVSKRSGQPRQDLVNHCKYHYGLPILFIDELERAALWRKAIKPLSKAERLKMMENTAVTSLFNVKECSDYIEQLIINYVDDYELPEKQ